MTFLFGGNRKNQWSGHVTRGMHRKIVATWSVVRDRTRSRSSIGERVCKYPFLLFYSTSCSKLADLLTCREDMFRWNMKGNFYEQSRMVHKTGVFLYNRNIYFMRDEVVVWQRMVNKLNYPRKRRNNRRLMF